MNNCKVIATYFGERRFWPSGYEETTKLLYEVFANESDTEAGVEYDVIVVNHLTDNEELNNKAKEFLAMFDNSVTTHGATQILHRPYDNGIGGSFKSFHYAFNTKPFDDYKFWAFTEDDVLLIAKDWFKKSIEQLKKDKTVSYVCMSKSNKKSLPCHCHSGAGVTHVDFLNKVFNKNGGLLYSKEPKPKDPKLLKQWYRKFELDGEVAFTNSFEEFGQLQDIQLSEPVVKIYQKKEPEFSYKHNL